MYYIFLFRHFDGVADFSSVALGEAAAAFSHQFSGLHILHAPARIHTGNNKVSAHCATLRTKPLGALL